MKTSCPTSAIPPNAGNDRPISTEPALLDTQDFIRTYGRPVHPRTASPLDLYDGAGLDDPELVRADLALLRQAWPSVSAPHRFRVECSELWRLPNRRTNETLLRMRQRKWIEMWAWFGAFTYHLLPDGAALLADAVEESSNPIF